MDHTLYIWAAALLWWVILLLPWRPWWTGEVLEADLGLSPNLADTTVLIPARNEAQVIEATLEGLLEQGKGLQIILVDDRSTDQTADLALSRCPENLVLVKGQPRPSGWTGKLWALEQGLAHVRTSYLLLLDADIRLAPGTIGALQEKMERENISFLSLMATLRVARFWERLLMPAFVYFFKLLYPFRLSNSRFLGVAAAAGGCILLKTDILQDMAGFRAIKGELIDDCALARQVKSRGYRTWIGLSRSVTSLRPYEDLKTIWDMVARTAFHQLRYSLLLLLVLTLAMGVLFWGPVVGLFLPSQTAHLVSWSALAAMMTTYLPTLRFYGLNMGWALFLPLIGTFYLAMTWTSAIRFYLGKGAAWKGRTYTTPPTP